jgi:hypothetical protein
MAIVKSFREIAIANSKKQPEMVDQLLDPAPLLDTMPMQPASHGLWNLYEEQGTVTGASLVDFDDELGEVGSDTELKQIDLSILGGVNYCGEDKAKKFGGYPAYLASQLPSILKKTGQDAEASVIYNNIRQYAIDNSNALDALGTGSTNYSIICVNWQPGQVTGLFDPEGFGQGAIMDIMPLNGGNLFPHTVSSKSILSYGARLKSYFGIQLANARYVSAIVNCDKTNSKLPSEAQLDDMIADARGQEGSTVIYMHRKLLTALFTYKASPLQMVPADRNKDRRIAEWNGIPIVTSYNFLDGTESKVTI